MKYAVDDTYEHIYDRARIKTEGLATRQATAASAACSSSSTDRRAKENNAQFFYESTSRAPLHLALEAVLPPMHATASGGDDDCDDEGNAAEDAGTVEDNDPLSCWL